MAESKANDKLLNRFFLVNPKGAVHEVTQEHAEQRINADPRYRMATEDEVAAFLSAGEQRADEPIGTPWAPKATRRVTVKPNG